MDRDAESRNGNPGDAVAEAVPPENLLAQEHWLRSLIGGMVGESDVDDLVQDTWIEAIKRPLTVTGSLRGWLRTVATRLAQRSHRTARRRRRREQLAAPGDAVPPADHALAWSEVRERVTAAVMGLREPYRGTLLMRFYDGLSAREIARRTATPIATVRIRLQRGMQHLRGEMTQRCGPDWRPHLAWFGLPIAGGLAGGSGAGAPVLSATRRLTLLAATAAGALGAVAVFGEDAPVEPAAPALVAEATVPAPTGPDAAAAAVERQPLPVRRHTDPVRRVAGRVLDPQGRPIGGAEIVFRRVLGPPVDPTRSLRGLRGSERRESPVELLPLGRAGADGLFDLPCPPGRGGLAARDGVVSLCLWPVGGDDCAVRNARIVAGRAVPLEGVVVGPGGRGIAEAEIEARCVQLPGFPGILDRHLFVDPVARSRTGWDGRFAIAGFPLGCHAVLVVRKAGYREVTLSPEPHDRSLSVRLAAATTTDPMRIAGRVYDGDGRLVCAAIVGIDRTRTRTDGGGEYRLEVAQLHDEARLYAGKAGHGTTVRTDIAAELRRHRGGTLFVDLTLGPEPRTIAGIVTDGRGVPLPDHLVFLADPTDLDGGSTTAEAIAAGQLDDPFGASDRADALGRFAIGGLADRDYRLRVYDPQHHNAVDGGTHAAGDRDVRVRIPQERFVSLPGRLIDDSGEPVVGAKVYFGCAARENSIESMQLRTPVVSDGEGRFRLQRVPREGGNLYVISGDAERDSGIVPAIIPLDRNSLDVAKLELRLARLCHFRVSAPTAPRRSKILLLDRYGDRLDILVRHATGCNHHRSWTLEDETTQVLCASERARTMVLLAPDGTEISRTEIFLMPDHLTLIDL